MTNQAIIQQFRDTVYPSFEQRGDAALDMLAALTGSMVVDRRLSVNPPYFGTNIVAYRLS